MHFFLFLAATALASPLPALKNTLAPMNAVKFCQRYPEDCEPRESTHAPATNAELLRELANVNVRVNHAFPEDIDKVGEPGVDPWLISPPKGNCADFAVTKRHELLALGWASSDLLLADAFVMRDDGHTVLLARVSDTYYVLDSLRPEVLPFVKVRYEWVKFQSDTDPNFWRAPANR